LGTGFDDVLRLDLNAVLGREIILPAQQLHLALDLGEYPDDRGLRRRRREQGGEYHNESDVPHGFILNDPGPVL
jgi:hypothetical protein